MEISQAFWGPCLQLWLEVFGQVNVFTEQFSVIRTLKVMSMYIEVIRVISVYGIVPFQSFWQWKVWRKLACHYEKTVNSHTVVWGWENLPVRCGRLSSRSAWWGTFRDLQQAQARSLHLWITLAVDVALLKHLL